MGEAWEVGGCEGEVKGYEQCPEGGEDEEVDLGGGVVVGLGIVPVGDCEER